LSGRRRHGVLIAASDLDAGGGIGGPKAVPDFNY
jgi:hypothetical protein